MRGVLARGGDGDDAMIKRSELLRNGLAKVFAPGTRADTMTAICSAFGAPMEVEYRGEQLVITPATSNWFNDAIAEAEREERLAADDRVRCVLLDQILDGDERALTIVPAEMWTRLSDVRNGTRDQIRREEAAKARRGVTTPLDVAMGDTLERMGSHVGIRRERMWVPRPLEFNLDEADANKPTPPAQTRMETDDELRERIRTAELYAIETVATRPQATVMRPDPLTDWVRQQREARIQARMRERIDHDYPGLLAQADSGDPIAIDRVRTIVAGMPRADW
jgi:hypothetical protein